MTTTRTQPLPFDATFETLAHMLTLRARMTDAAINMLTPSDLRSQVIDEINEVECYEELMRQHPETDMTDKWVIAHVLVIALTYSHDDDCRCSLCIYSPNCPICY